MKEIKKYMISEEVVETKFDNFGLNQIILYSYSQHHGCYLAVDSINENGRNGDFDCFEDLFNMINKEVFFKKYSCTSISSRKYYQNDMDEWVEVEQIFTIYDKDGNTIDSLKTIYDNFLGHTCLNIYYIDFVNFLNIVFEDEFYFDFHCC